MTLGKLFPSKLKRWLLIANVAYCGLSMAVLIAMALLHREPPHPALLAHWTILSLFMGYWLGNFWRARQEFKRARRELLEGIRGQIRQLADTGILDHDRETPSLTEVTVVMSLSSILHDFEPRAKLEIAMLDGWLAHWGITRIASAPDRKWLWSNPRR